MKDDIRWGIVGPGRIARRLAEEWPQIEGARLAGVASRDRTRAEGFAAEFGVGKVHDDYEAMFADPEIDIVYIAVPHNFHLPLVRRAMAAGKAVFCEKPMGLDAGECAEMVALSELHGLFLMEAVKTRFMPALRQAQAWVGGGRIGKPGLLEAHFCFDVGGDPDCRHLSPHLAGGAVLDLGVYPLTLAEMLLGPQPRDIRAVADLVAGGVDATTAITLRYDSGAVAQLTVSVAVAAGTHARLWGSEGFIDIPRFSQATTATLHTAGSVEEFRQKGEGTFVFEIDEANRCLREGMRESPVMSHEASLRMARWQDAILASARNG